MTDPLDWSDLSKLQTRDGSSVRHAHPVFGGKILVISRAPGETEDDYHEVCHETGRANCLSEGPSDVIPRPPAKPKTIKVCRPMYCYSKESFMINDNLEWSTSEYWRSRIEDWKETHAYGPLEYRDFEVSDA